MGLFGKNHAAIYDARNPLCAPVFHQVHDLLLGPGSSKRVFGWTTRLNIDTAAKCGAGYTVSTYEAERLYGEFALGWLQREAERSSKSSHRDDPKIGLEAGARHAAMVTFGAATWLLGPDPYAVFVSTKSLLFYLKETLASDRSRFVKDAGQAIVAFGSAYELSDMSDQPRHVIAVKMAEWAKGYEPTVRPATQSRANLHSLSPARRRNVGPRTEPMSRVIVP